MEKNSEVSLGSVQETLLLPLWGRAYETRKGNPLLVDPDAVRIIDSIKYDFSRMEKKVNPLSRGAWISRSLYFDGEIRKFIETSPDATIVNIGCGLDTTFERVDNGKIRWFDLDFPDVIALRRQYLAESGRRKFIASSALDDSWYGMVGTPARVLFLIAGVIYYIKEESIRVLFKNFADRFRSCDVIFDYSSTRGVRIANKMVIRDGGMSTDANLVWALDKVRELEKWDSRIRVLDSMPMFKKFKKNYPPYRRLGMNISDALKIQSLAHIRIGES